MLGSSASCHVLGCCAIEKYANTFQEIPMLENQESKQKVDEKFPHTN
jgi:hypothetical protein